ncbi:MAG: hypothetical protein U0414_05085 [Polyangiaceae bacterium]
MSSTSSSSTTSSGGGGMGGMTTGSTTASTTSSSASTGTGGAPPSLCDSGCSSITVPAFHGPQSVEFLVPFNPTDITGIAAHIRMCMETPGSAQIRWSYASGSAVDAPTAGAYADTVMTSAVQSCALGMQDIPVAITSSDPTFNSASVVRLTLRLVSLSVADETVAFKIDSITTAGNEIGPWNFETRASAIAMVPALAHAGTTITWVNQ